MAKKREDNLRPITLSHEEATENGRKGGKASAASRRRKKQLKGVIDMVMSLPVDEGTKQVLGQFGIDEDDQNVQAAIAFNMALQAMRGNVKAAEWLAKYAGEDPHLAIEKERLKVEKKKLDLQEKLGAIPLATDDSDTDDVVIYLPENGRDEDGN